MLLTMLVINETSLQHSQHRLYTLLHLHALVCEVCIVYVGVHEIDKEKHPDCLADSCKRLSVNQMAAGSRLPRSSHGFFSPFSTFSNTLL